MRACGALFIQPNQPQLSCVVQKAQAKSGTGKTCVFSVIALEAVKPQAISVQVLVLAPTRELAVQIHDVITTIGRHTGVVVSLFIGGDSVGKSDVEAARTSHIAVGTPGRIVDLIERKQLATSAVRLLILDEADKLVDGGFRPQINAIIATLPERKQMLALSATYPPELAAAVQIYMRSPVHVRLNAGAPSLDGVSQFYATIAAPTVFQTNEEKTMQVLSLLEKLRFRQCEFLKPFRFPSDVQTPFI